MKAGQQRLLETSDASEIYLVCIVIAILSINKHRKLTNAHYNYYLLISSIEESYKCQKPLRIIIG